MKVGDERFDWIPGIDRYGGLPISRRFFCRRLDRALGPAKYRSLPLILGITPPEARAIADGKEDATHEQIKLIADFCDEPADYFTYKEVNGD